MIRRPPRSPLFPYTPLSRSESRLRPLVHPVLRPGRRLRPVCEVLATAPRLLGVVLRTPPSRRGAVASTSQRSEEHTSELQSQSNLVCRLLLEKKKRTCTSGDPFIFPNVMRRTSGHRLEPPIPSKSKSLNRAFFTSSATCFRTSLRTTCLSCIV